VLLVHELRLGLLQAVEGVGRARVLGLVGVDEQRLLAVDVLDVTVWDAGLQAQDGVGVQPKGLEDAVDLCILFRRRRWVTRVLVSRYGCHMKMGATRGGTACLFPFLALGLENVESISLVIGLFIVGCHTDYYWLCELSYRV
jgi:hypothetical protein